MVWTFPEYTFLTANIPWLQRLAFSSVEINKEVKRLQWSNKQNMILMWKAINRVLKWSTMMWPAYVNRPRFHNMFGVFFSCEAVGINTSMKQQAVSRPFQKHERFWIYFKLPDLDISYVQFVSIFTVIEKRLFCAACPSWGLLNWGPA